MSVVNPYDFLGVTPTSSLTEVRRAYFRLSLLCHPDKGGRADDMRILQSAYEWITHHIETVKSHGTETYEEKEDNFKEFLESQQQEKILAWDELVKDALELRDGRFDELYNVCKYTDDDYTKKLVAHVFFSRLRCLMNQEISHPDLDSFKEQLMQSCVEEMKNVSKRGWFNASIHGGYGEYLQSLPEDIEAPIAENKSFGKKELILYEEPSALPLARPLGTFVLPLEKLEDYSTDTLCDYRMAHQDTNKPLEKLEESMADRFTMDVEAQLSDLQAQREQVYQALHGNSGIESHRKQVYPSLHLAMEQLEL